MISRFKVLILHCQIAKGNKYESSHEALNKWCLHSVNCIISMLKPFFSRVLKLMYCEFMGRTGPSRSTVNYLSTKKARSWCCTKRDPTRLASLSVCALLGFPAMVDIAEMLGAAYLLHM